MIIDLSQVDFIDSSGLSALIAVARTGATVVLRRPTTAIRRAIEVTGLTGLFDLEYLSNPRSTCPDRPRADCD